MRILLAIAFIAVTTHATETTEVPYFENGKFSGTRKVKVTPDGELTSRKKLIKGDEAITKVQTKGFRVAAMDPSR